MFVDILLSSHKKEKQWNVVDKAQSLTPDDLRRARDSDISLTLEFIQVTCPP